MLRKKIISFFLLFLLLLVNGHNSFLHAHPEEKDKQVIIAHEHQHHHHHGGHQHAAEVHSFWNWFHQLFGDFEHPDLGEDHFESFLRSGNQIGLDLSAAVGFQVFLPPFELLSLSILESHSQKNILVWVLSFADPPFHDAQSNRGPPSFS